MASIVGRSGISAGTVTVFVKHPSASLVIMGNADPSARRYLEVLKWDADEMRDLVEVGVVTQERQAKMECERGNPKIVSGNGSAMGFQVEAKVGINGGEVRGNGGEFGRGQIPYEPIFVAFAVARLADAELVFTQDNDGNDKPGGGHERITGGRESIRPC